MATATENEVKQIQKVWRSEIGLIGLFFISILGSVIGSWLMPTSLLRDYLIRWSTGEIDLTLPAWWLTPAAIWLSLIYRMYNVLYMVNERGIETTVGRLSLCQDVTQIRYEDIRSLETKQTLPDRLLDVGTVEVGTAATKEVEVSLRGVASPAEVREMILAEQERRGRVAA